MSVHRRYQRTYSTPRLVGVAACCAAIMMLAPGARADDSDVFFDNLTAANTTSSGPVHSVTFSHTTTTEDDRTLVVNVVLVNHASCDAGAKLDECEVASITYDGTGLSLKTNGTNDDGGVRVEQWVMSAPSTGSNSVVVTIEGTSTMVTDMVLSAVTMYNTRQPPGDPVDASGCRSPTSVTSASSLTFSPEARDGCVDVIGIPQFTASNRTLTAHSGQTNGTSGNTGTTDADAVGGFSTKYGLDGFVNFRWTVGGGSVFYAACGVAIGPPTPPTEARLLDFEALSSPLGVLLRWQTGFEVDNLGFRVWREDGDDMVPVSESLIAGSALFAGASTELSAGRSYALWDVPTGNDAGLRYWLEDIDLDGTSTLRGPFTADPMPTHQLLELMAELDAGGPTYLHELTTTNPSHPLHRTATAGSGRLDTLQWDLAASSAAKIAISEEGWYRVTRRELVEAGFDPGSDPTGLQLFAEGQEQAILVTGIDDGWFDMDDAIEFYGLGLDKSATDTRIYWLTVGEEAGLRVAAVDLAPVFSSEWATEFPYTLERKDRTTYFAALTTNGDRDNFYGAVVTSTPVDQVLTVDQMPTRADISAPASLEISLQGVSQVEHVVTVHINGHAVGTMTFANREAEVATFEVDPSWLARGDNVVSLTSIGASPDVSLVDSIRLEYLRPYGALDGTLRMTAEQGQLVRVSDFAVPEIRLVDVTDPARVMEFEGRIFNTGPAGSAIVVANTPPGWLPGNVSSLYAFAGNMIKSPARISANTPSRWSDPGNSADFLIVTHGEFQGAAQSLAAHRAAQGLTVEVVDVEDVFDEFSHGAKDPAAIRDLVARATETWSRPPQWVLLVGDATFDPRNYLGFGNFDFVPTHLEGLEYFKSAVDDWFVDLGGNGPSLALGRLPVRTLSQADTTVAKIIAYDSAETGAWSERVRLIADEYDDRWDFEAMVTELAATVPPDLGADQILVGQMGSGAAHDAIVDAFNSGSLVVDFVGHGSQTTWTQDALFDADDVAALTNSD